METCVCVRVCVAVVGAAWDAVVDDGCWSIVVGVDENGEEVIVVTIVDWGFVDEEIVVITDCESVDKGVAVVVSTEVAGGIVFCGVVEDEYELAELEGAKTGISEPATALVAPDGNFVARIY